MCVMETLAWILDGDIATLIGVLTCSLTIWMSGCIGYALGVWRKGRLLELQVPPTVSEIVFGFEPQLQRARSLAEKITQLLSQLGQSPAGTSGPRTLTSTASLRDGATLRREI